ncbi:MAG TPA: hypothetical protein VJY34_07590 [Roseiarcus sp.]|nr:hypothetical protein [Roseiarcus sp.]
MTFFSTFVLTYGFMLVTMAVMASWLFRSSSAPLWAKVGLPILIVALACVTPLEVNPMMGLPVTASPQALPERAQLIAFVPHDEAKLVDLWLRCDEGPPRSYETQLDERMKKTLRQAQQEMDSGRLAMLAKRKTAGQTAASSANGLPDDQTEYVLDESVRSALPPKE